MRYKIALLRAVSFMLYIFPETECKTIGNMNPIGMHCLMCSIYELRKTVKAHLDFWETPVSSREFITPTNSTVARPKTVQRWEEALS